MKFLARMSILGALTFVGILLAFHGLAANVDPNWQPISEYSLGEYGVAMRIAFLALAVSMLALATMLWRTFTGTAGKIAACMIFVAGLGNILGGVFNTDPSGTPADQMTTSGQIHAGAAGSLGLFVLATLVVLSLFLWKKPMRSLAMPIVIATVLLWIAEIALVTAMASYLGATHGVIGPETPFGWHARILLLLCVVWIVVTTRQVRIAADRASVEMHELEGIVTR